MSFLSLHSFKFRLGLIFILVAILLQAMPSSPFPSSRDRGSAFDATTVEVAVLVQRDDTDQQGVVTDPAPPLDLVVEQIAEYVLVTLSFEAPPRQTGPPLWARWRVLPPTRAPPIFT